MRFAHFPHNTMNQAREGEDSENQTRSNQILRLTSKGYQVPVSLQGLLYHNCCMKPIESFFDFLRLTHYQKRHMRAPAFTHGGETCSPQAHLPLDKHITNLCIISV